MGRQEPQTQTSLAASEHIPQPYCQHRAQDAVLGGWSKVDTTGQPKG